MFFAAVETPDVRINVAWTVAAAFGSGLGALIVYWFSCFARKTTHVKTAIIFLLACLTALSGVNGMRWFDAANFEAQVKSYLFAAYDAPSKEKAIKYMDNALCYLDRRGANEGFTSILAPAQTDDLGEFYEALRESRVAIDAPLMPNDKGVAVPPDKVPWQTALMNSGVIAVSNGKKELQKYPDGIHAAPYNREYFWATLGSAFLTILGTIWACTAAKRKNRAVALAEKQKSCPHCLRTQEELEKMVREKLLSGNK